MKYALIIANTEYSAPHLARLFTLGESHQEKVVHQASRVTDKPKSRSKISTCVISAGILLGALVLFFGGSVMINHIPSQVSPSPAPTSAQTSTITPSPTATLIPELPVGSTMISEKGGMTLVFVPAGEFTMGSDADDSLTECQKFRNDCKRDWFVDGEPPHQVYLDSFWVDQTEVTDTMYALCVNAEMCVPPAETVFATTPSIYDYFGNPTFNDYPVINVDWNQAKAYCEWVGRRLPTEAEWEKAARGTDGRTYPWGEGIDCNRANVGGCVGDTTKVGSYESGKSPYGTYDMAGNVWEWVADWYSEIYYQSSPAENPLGPSSGEYRAARGGSWFSSGSDARSAGRGWPDPSLTHFDLGFRCALSFP